MTINVTLSPALEAFARERVESGAYASIDDVVREAVALLQARDARRAVFAASLVEASAEAERVGCRTIDEAMVDIDAIIEADER